MARTGPRAVWRAEFTSGPHRCSSVDEVQTAVYGLLFQVAYLEKKGVEFDDWFNRLAGAAYGDDFESIRPYGRSGDYKCDGRRLSSRTVFQCYAPERMDERLLIRKIDEDFHGALTHWRDWMAEWTFVHNARQGLPPRVLKHLDALRTNHPEVRIRQWAESELRKLAGTLGLGDQQAIFGFSPSKAGIETLVMEDLRPVIHQLERTESSPKVVPVTPPSVDKLNRNALSVEAADLLRIGRRKEALVDAYFRKNPRAELGETIAEAFRIRYTHLKGEGKSPDGILAHLQEYAGSGSDPKRQGAALAVLSYFFERCDIFEDPVTEP